MSNWSGGVMTAAGRALQLKVEAGTTALELTRFKLGDGAEAITDVDSMTDLLSSKTPISISSTEITAGGMCKVTGNLSSSGITTGFYAREFGLFATDPDAGEILYMICIDSVPDFIPAGSASIATASYAMNIAISNASNISITVDPNAFVTVSQMNSAACILQRSTAYQLKDVLYDTQLRPGLYLYCIQSGQTSSGILDLTGAKKGDIINDGDVKWQIRAVTICWDVDDNGNIRLLS